MIGNNIRKVREGKNLGVNQLAKLAGINASYLSALERGEKKNPSTLFINKVAKALQVPRDLLLKENTNTIEEITNELLKISDFSAIGDMTSEDKKQAVQDILEQDPAIFYELDSELQNKFIIKESPANYNSLYATLPKEAQKEVDTFMEYIKHKYNVKE
jgi:transcriptional regulator with XRE-family HTH domain